MNTSPIEEKFRRAVDALVEQVKEDRSVLAAILCGSLSHDTVWAKSDVDLVFVTIDDKKTPQGGISLYADGVNVHAMLMPRAVFRSAVEGSVRNSFTHSFLAKGKLLYTHDESIAALAARLHDIGERDTQLQLLRAGIHSLGPIDKAHKWMLTRGDLDYTALWILYAATPLAQIEVIGRRLLADREVIPQATRLNPAFFKMIYLDLLNEKKTPKAISAALDAVDTYLAERTPVLFGAVIEHLRDVGETRSCTEIDNYFERTLGVGGATLACEYLADRGIIGKASTAVQLTKKSNVSVQELAFFYTEPPTSKRTKRA
jgi:uncharacterized protein